MEKYVALALKREWKRYMPLLVVLPRLLPEKRSQRQLIQVNQMSSFSSGVEADIYEGGKANTAVADIGRGSE